MGGNQRADRENSKNPSGASHPDQGDRSVCQPPMSMKRLPRFSRSHATDLATIITRDIVPALLVEFGAASRTSNTPTPLAFSAQDLSKFAGQVLVLPAASLTAITEQYIEAGHTVENVLLELLAPVARQLGALWDSDDVSFVDVTLGVQKMQHVLHSICRSDQELTTRQDRPKALLVPAPGDSHTFGLITMSELLRRRGWLVFGGTPMSQLEINQMASTMSFAMVGFSISADALIKPTATAIRTVRKKSVNKNVKIVVGGRVAGANTNLATELGADAAFSDGNDACHYADSVAADMYYAKR